MRVPSPRWRRAREMVDLSAHAPSPPGNALPQRRLISIDPVFNGMTPLRRFGKILLWVFGTLVGLVVVAVIGVYTLLHSSYLLEQAQGRASKATGRAVTMASLDIDWSWTPVVNLRKVNLANSDWGEAEQMFSAEAISFAILFWLL